MTTSASLRTCPGCQRGGGRPVMTTKSDGLAFTYVECNTCGSLYLAELPSTAFLHDLYQKHETLCIEPEGAPSPSRATSVPRFLRPHLWPPGPGRNRAILDIGCSSGWHLEDFASRGWRVAGSDIDATAIATATQRMPNGEFHAGELAEAVFQSAPFDIIRLDNTLEHVPDPVAVLKQARRWLKPGGAVLAYVPHGHSGSIGFLGPYSINIWPPFHLQLFSRDGLCRAFHLAGYDTARAWGYTPRGTFASSFEQWRRGAIREGAAPHATLYDRAIEACVWPLLAITRHQEELIGVGRVAR